MVHLNIYQITFILFTLVSNTYGGYSENVTNLISSTCFANNSNLAAPSLINDKITFMNSDNGRFHGFHPYTFKSEISWLPKKSIAEKFIIKIVTEAQLEVQMFDCVKTANSIDYSCVFEPFFHADHPTREHTDFKFYHYATRSNNTKKHQIVIHFENLDTSFNNSRLVLEYQSNNTKEKWTDCVHINVHSDCDDTELCDGLLEERMNFCYNLSQNCYGLFKCANGEQFPIEAECVSKGTYARWESESECPVCWNRTDNLQEIDQEWVKYEWKKWNTIDKDREEHYYDENYEEEFPDPGIPWLQVRFYTKQEKIYIGIGIISGVLLLVFIAYVVRKVVVARRRLKNLQKFEKVGDADLEDETNQETEFVTHEKSRLI